MFSGRVSWPKTRAYMVMLTTQLAGLSDLEYLSAEMCLWRGFCQPLTVELSRQAARGSLIKHPCCIHMTFSGRTSFTRHSHPAAVFPAS